MLDGDRKRALALLDRIFSNQGESPSRIAPMILGAIASHHRRLFSAHELMLQNKSSEEVRRAVGLFGNRLNRFNEMARRTDRSQLLTALKRIAETDVALKHRGDAPTAAELDRLCRTNATTTSRCTAVEVDLICRRHSGQGTNAPPA